MFHFIPSKRYQSLLSKCNKTNSELLENIRKAMKLITENPKHPSLHTHKTNVRIQKEKAFSSKVTGEHRLIWKWSKKQKDTILLIDFGTHKEVYL